MRRARRRAGVGGSPGGRPEGELTPGRPCGAESQGALFTARGGRGPKWEIKSPPWARGRGGGPGGAAGSRATVSAGTFCSAPRSHGRLMDAVGDATAHTAEASHGEGASRVSPPGPLQPHGVEEPVWCRCPELPETLLPAPGHRRHPARTWGRSPRRHRQPRFLPGSWRRRRWLWGNFV